MHFKELSLKELRKRWTDAWNIEPHRWIGLSMLERSLAFKIREQDGYGLTPEQKQRLNKLVTAYKRNPNYFDQGHTALKPGMQLIRNWQGEAHAVTVTANGFSYQNKEYSSLSNIANEITGSRWNGWLFFGLKNKKEAA
jgi:hypothetical protein